MAEIPEGAGDNSFDGKPRRVIAPALGIYMLVAVLIAFGLMYFYATSVG